MISKDQLKKGIEWVSKKTKITAKYRNRYLEIKLYPDYPNEQNSIYLYLKIQSDNKVVVTDLLGNGYNTDYQNSGYGTLIFNIAIQALYALFGISNNGTLASQINVCGMVSSQGDPEEGPERLECRSRRNSFWEKRGFKLKEPEAFDTYMKARLIDLVIRSHGITANGTPRSVSLCEFWPTGKAPDLLRSDLQALISIDINKLSLEECPSKSDIENTLIKANLVSRITRWVIRILLSSISIYLIILLAGPIDTLKSSLFVILGSYVVSLLVDSHIWKHLPYYKEHYELQEENNAVIRKVKTYIERIETDHNGLIWRLHHGLKGYDTFIDNEVFSELAAASKKQNVFKLEDEYEDYIRFIRSARDTIIKNALMDA